MPLFGQTVSLAERKQALSNVMRERAEKRYVAATKSTTLPSARRR